MSLRPAWALSETLNLNVQRDGQDLGGIQGGGNIKIYSIKM